MTDSDGAWPFAQLDYLYTPVTDVAAETRYFVNVLGAELVFAIDDGGTKVAMLRLTESPPTILLTDHLEGDRPILVYRVPDLDAASDHLRARGWTTDRSVELPPGPASTFRTPGGNRIALYEASRPFVVAGFAGRRDFS
jgi:catechol 2,3-dioxygenase-like lactoylglutathione lyase family enzyme